MSISNRITRLESELVPAGEKQPLVIIVKEDVPAEYKKEYSVKADEYVAQWFEENEPLPPYNVVTIPTWKELLGVCQ